MLDLNTQFRSASATTCVLSGIGLLVSVLWLHEIGKGLGLLKFRGMVVVVVFGADVDHLVDAATLRTSFDRAILGQLNRPTSQSGTANGQRVVGKHLHRAR